jgi:tyrosyl-tRNA synthetase
VHAIGTPLITNSDGTKFGKSEGNAVWLDPALTSPYAFYQFWLNTDDADVIDRLKIFTFLGRSEIERLERAVAEEPFRREAQRTLAFEVTALVHGVSATEGAIAAAAALFGQGALDSLDESTLAAAISELPTLEVSAETTILEALVGSGLVGSSSEARRAISQGGVYLNNVKVERDGAVVGESLLSGRHAVLRRGKKTLAGLVASA